MSARAAPAITGITSAVELPNILSTAARRLHRPPCHLHFFCLILVSPLLVRSSSPPL